MRGTKTPVPYPEKIKRSKIAPLRSTPHFPQIIDVARFCATVSGRVKILSKSGIRNLTSYPFHTMF
jgi:hypothetical protein